MFTQLDLFGNLPAPEKPSNQPQRAEKKSAARSSNTSSATASQTQLSMGLTEHTYPEPSRDWSEQEETKQPAQPEQPVAVTSEQIGNDINNIGDQTETEQPSAEMILNTPDPNTSLSTEEKSPKNEAAPGITNKEIREETRAEKGRRYYIQTEIPADPPLAEKPPGPEMMMAGLINTRITAQEPKPRYIQTEIPSEPVQTEINSGNKDEEIEGLKTPTVNQNPPKGPDSPTGPSTTENAVSELQKRDTSVNAIPAESLRRTRPLMPPKVILAEPDQPAITTPPQIEANIVNPISVAEPKPEEPKPQPKVKAEKKITEPALFPLNTVSAENLPSDETSIGEKAGFDKPQPSSRRKKVVKDAVPDIAGPIVPPDDQLNARQYYSIGEVATMFGVKSSLLRYWESEFDVLKLRKNRKGDRFFRPDDIRSLQLIHHLLRDKKYTIEGAREYMRNAGKMKEKFETIEALQRIRQFLVEMRNGLQIERVPEA